MRATHVGCWVVLNGLCSLCRLISSYLYIRQCVHRFTLSWQLHPQHMCPKIIIIVSSLACHVLSSARACRSSICPGHLSTGWLVSLVILSPSGDTRGPSVVFEAAAQDHLIFLTFLIISMTFVLSLTQILVFLSLYVLLSIVLFILVCAAASLFCACLVSVHVSAP